MEYICVRIDGLNLTRLVDRLIAEGVLVKNLVFKDRFIRFELPNDKLGVLNKICKSENKFYEVVYRGRMRRAVAKLPYLFGSLLAMIVVVAYIVSFNLFVFKINLEYVTSSDFELAKVEKFLDENGYAEGMLRGQVDTKKLQMEIVKNFDDVSGCTVRLVGGSLYVTVYPAMVKEGEKVKEIKSKFDAVVTKAEAYSGELKVKVGDIVKKGQVMISDNVEAKGDVEGKVYFTSSVIYNDHQQYMEKTGKTYTYDNLIFCKRFRINGKNECKFSNYHQSICRFYLNAKLFLPIEIERITLYEVIVKEKVVPFLEVEDEVMKQAYDEAKLAVPKDEQIANVTYSVVSEGNFTRVDCFIEVEMSLI